MRIPPCTSPIHIPHNDLTRIPFPNPPAARILVCPRPFLVFPRDCILKGHHERAFERFARTRRRSLHQPVSHVPPPDPQPCAPCHRGCRDRPPAEAATPPGPPSPSPRRCGAAFARRDHARWGRRRRRRGGGSL